jgi:hypothetical protein
MYLRNAKQILRAGAFDERRYGFGGLLDLLRACQRDGLIRLERDRRGGLRVFQGPALQRTAPPRVEPGMLSVEAVRDQQEPAADLTRQDIETIDTVTVSSSEVVDDADIIDVDTVAIVDTTAELLGRATSKRRPRSASPRKVTTRRKRPTAGRQ